MTVFMRVASLILPFTHAYSRVPITVSALALVVLQAFSAIVQISLQQVILVFALYLSFLVVQGTLLGNHHII